MNNNNWHLEETYKSMMMYGNSVLRFILLVNGGAIIAILTFWGNLLKNGATEFSMAWPMGCFIGGIVVGGGAHITAYFTQFALFNEESGRSLKRGHDFWLGATMLFIVIGIVLFAAGATFALFELQSYSAS